MNTLVPQPHTQEEIIAQHQDELRKLGFIDESGNLTRPVTTHTDKFREEATGRTEFDPGFAELGELPEMHFLVDVPEKGTEKVYPFHEESYDVLRTIGRFFPGRKFAAAIGCFAGAGHTEVKLRNSQSLQQGAPINSIDVYPRAIQLAKANAVLNDSEAQFYEGDITDRERGFKTIPQEARKQGETVYFGNAPFALSTPQSKLATCRDGGTDGLQKTMTFVQAALEDGSAGDAIVGVAYSRVGKDGNYEFEDRLKTLQAQGAKKFTYKIEIIEGAKLWRGFNGKKEQENPMDLDMMRVKAAPESDMYREYETMAVEHKKEGWGKLAYVRYAIEISDPTKEGVGETREAIAKTVAQEAAN